MTEQDPRDEFAHDIVNLAHEKYGLIVDDVIMTCLHVATALAAEETKFGEEDKIRNRLLEITETGFDLTFQKKNSNNPDAKLNQ